jgi:hypothetical protein
MGLRRSRLRLLWIELADKSVRPTKVKTDVKTWRERVPAPH